MQEKYRELTRILEEMGSVLVAFSGGVDSSLLLKAAYDALGERSLAVTAVSPTLTGRELDEAKAVAAGIGASHITIEVDELEFAEFVANPPERCYHCKRIRFSALDLLKEERGLAWIAEGANVDDEGDWRPGMKAAAELGVRSPLREAGLTKAQIRELSASLGLSTWDKPSAACLASRVPYGEEVTREKLRQIGEAEEYLRGLGLSQVRVRHHGRVARIEVPRGDMASLLERSDAVVAALKGLGFNFVALDLYGFASGSLNVDLTK